MCPNHGTVKQMIFARRFFFFFRDVSRKTTCFGSIVRRHLSNSCLKTYGFVRDVPTKLNTTLHRSATKSPSTGIHSKLEAFGTYPRDPRREPCHRIRAFNFKNKYLLRFLTPPGGSLVTKNGIYFQTHIFS